LGTVELGSCPGASKIGGFHRPRISQKIVGKYTWWVV